MAVKDSDILGLMTTVTDPIALLSEAFNQNQEETAWLREELERVEDQMLALRMEDIGWQSLTGQPDSDEGITLTTLKRTSQMLKEDVAGSPLPKQANAVRFSYTFGQPFIIAGLDQAEPVTDTPTLGRPKKPLATKKKLKDFVESRAAQDHLFGIEGQWMMSTACSTDSMYMLIGDDSSNDLKPIPLTQITAQYIDPEYPGVVQACLREWTSIAPDGTRVAQAAWYYVDTFEGVRATKLPAVVKGAATVPVAKGKTLFVLSVGRQVGWALGIPDLMAGIVWNRNFITMMNHGKAVSELLATYAAKVTKNSKANANAAGVKIAQQKRGVASTVAVSEGNSLDVFTSAGKTYDFGGLRPVAEIYAASVGVSVVDILASPGAAGSSYGAASALAPGMRRDIETRRKLVALFMERVIEWAVGERVNVTPADINEIDPYRRAQIIMLAANSGLVWTDEMRPEVLRMAGLTSKHDTEPPGYMLQNNEHSLALKSIDTDGVAPTTSSVTPAGGGGASGTTTPAPDQGKSSGDGGAGSTMANGTRTDTISK